jgi:inhibitor of KinA sporulation pathway (predicted exonuclease)
MRIDRPRYLIIDLEATCDDRGAVPRGEMETIEIGAVLMDATDFFIEDRISVFVRPVRHPVLTDFCTELTSIQQAQVDAAPRFPEALATFMAWAGPPDQFLFCSWGFFDKAQLAQDCRYHHVPYPLGEGHLNLKAAFAQAKTLRKEVGLARALTQVGLAFEGTHHRGIDDAVNIARVTRKVCTGQS